MPHPEVNYIICKKESLTFNHLVPPNSHIAVYPHFSQIDSKNLLELSPLPAGMPKFICEINLGKLCSKLRLLGFDSLFLTDENPRQICALAAKDNRIILSRSISLLKHKEAKHGYWLRSANVVEQIIEVTRQFLLHKYLNPFSRCALCNGELKSVQKSEILDMLPPQTKLNFNEFKQCRNCQQIYWKGSHYKKILRFVEENFK